jgi:acyl-CoA synthetase (AMP-forming)/AMP-acid ligase II
MNIVDPILFQCRYQPATPALCAPGTGIGLISYARLEQFIHNISHRVIALGLLPGTIAAVSIEDPIFHTAIILALTRLGLVTLSGRVERFPPELKIGVIITDRPLPSLPHHRVVLADLSWTTGDGRPVDSSHAMRSSGNDTCRIILTSGTTGDAKAVAISHKLMFDRIGRHHAVFGPRLAACSRLFSDMTLSTSLGFQFLIYILWRGGMFFFVGNNFDNTLQAFEQYKIGAWVAAPAGLANLLSQFEKDGSYQSPVELIISGGDLLSAALSERVRTRICSHLVSAYGSTEASLTASAPAHAIAHIRGAVGYVTPGISIQVVNEADDILPVTSEGIIRIRSEFGVSEYLSNPSESAKAFRDGWYYPGDIGALMPDNILTITGRHTTVLNIGGEKIAPETIEQILLAFAGVEQAGVFGIRNDLGLETVWAAIVAAKKIDMEQLTAHCREHLPAFAVPAYIAVTNTLPRNAMGKIDRNRLPEFTKSQKAPSLQ